MPTVTVKPVDETYDDRANESWPAVEYTGLPAVSADGAFVAVVEERDGWGHVVAFGVRVLDVASSATGAWIPLNASTKAPRGAPALKRAVPAMQQRAKMAAGFFTTQPWELLVGGDTAPSEDGSWRVEGARIVVTSTDAGQPKRLVITDATTNDALADMDVSSWSRANVRCAGTTVELVGVSRPRRVAVFRQGVGPTTHACDGVVVPMAYRVVRLAK